MALDNRLPTIWPMSALSLTAEMGASGMTMPSSTPASRACARHSRALLATLATRSSSRRKTEPLPL